MKAAMEHMSTTRIYHVPDAASCIRRWLVVLFMLSWCATSSASHVSLPLDIDWFVGFTQEDGCESHPHAGVHTKDGGYLLVGDSVCYDGQRPGLERSIFVVKSNANGEQVWQTTLGDVGWNYGKYGIELPDGTFLIGGSMSTYEGREGYPYVERRALIRLDPQSGDVLCCTLFPNTYQPKWRRRPDAGVRDGVMGLALGNDSSEEYPASGTIYATGYVGGEPNFDPLTPGGYDDEPLFYIYGGAAFVAKLAIDAHSSATNGAHSKTPHGTSECPIRMKWEIVLDEDFLGDSLGHGVRAMQGMRILGSKGTGDDAESIALVAATDVDEENGSIQPSVIKLEAAYGKLHWARLFAPQGDSARRKRQSHPYAFAHAGWGRDEDDGYIVVGHQFTGANDGQPVGRAFKVNSSDGTTLWDTTFCAQGLHVNTECYGVARAFGGYVITCGAGVEPELWPKEPSYKKTWSVYNALLEEGSGLVKWQANFTNPHTLLNNAGEYAVSTSDGVVLYVDSQSVGDSSTGGNFGLMKLTATGLQHAEAQVYGSKRKGQWQGALHT